MARTKTEGGRVSLVGAGPGDPELLTLRAARVLAECDLVLHDALVPPDVVSLAGGLAVSVGKRGGRKSWSQDAIMRLLIRAARGGRHVVRLKCGDPFVFGRGGEEMLALRAAGIDVEIVPGVSSAIAAPAFAGVPVTHRGLASGFVVLTANPDAVWRDAVTRLAPHDGAAPLTLVFMMGVAARHEIARTLIASSWSASTPAMLVLGGTHRHSWTWAGTVNELATLSIPEDVADLPGTIVIGSVAALAESTAAARAGERDRHQNVGGGAA